MFDLIIGGYRFLYLQLAALVGYGWAIVALSFICSFLMLPLMRAVAGVVRREKDYEDVIDPQVAAIKSKYASDMERHLHIQRLYVRYGYSPLSAVKKVMPLFVQIPFLLLTYYMLKGTSELSGVSFLFLCDLGRPDSILRLPLFPSPINLLPLVMTFVNVITVFSTPGFTRRDWTQAIGIALLFLALLYTAPSALLLYWTLNNAITMVRTLLAKKCEGAKLLMSNLAELRNLPKVVYCALTASRLEAISLALFLASLYMALMVVKHVWFFNCYISGILMCPTVLLAIAIHALASCRGKGRFMVLPGCLFLASLFMSVGLISVAALSFFCPKAVQWFNAMYNPMRCFCVFIGLWVLIRIVFAVCDVKIRRGIVPAFLGESHWLLLSIILALHYSFSSDLVKLPIDSIVMLAVKLLVPAVVLAIALGIMFSAHLSLSRVVRVGFIFSAAAYLVPMISTESGPILSYQSNLVVRLVFISLLVLASLRLSRRTPVLVMLVTLLVMTGANAIYQSFAIQEEKSERAQTQGTEAERAFQVATAIRTNNVYLLVYDSYAHDQVLEDLGIPSRIQEILAPCGFTRYDAYSVGSDTVQSMGNSFAIGGVTQGSVRSMMAGNNPFCDFLVRAGYSTSYLLCAYDMPGRGEKMPGDFYFPTPQKVTRLEDVLFSCVLRGYLSQSANTFNAYSSEQWTAEKRRVICEAQPFNSFVYAHSERPGHAAASEAYRKSLTDEVAAYAKRLAMADSELEEDVGLILAKEADPIIIVASDHGSFLRLCARGDYGRLDLLDRCGIQLYIRWPKGYEPTLKINCLTDVFLEVMICLTGDTSLARFESDGVSLPIQAPLKAPVGTIKRGVIQNGRDNGMGLFEGLEK